jgi:hypothetical protein
MLNRAHLIGIIASNIPLIKLIKNSCKAKSNLGERNAKQEQVQAQRYYNAGNCPVFDIGR